MWEPKTHIHLIDSTKTWAVPQHQNLMQFNHTTFIPLVWDASIENYFSFRWHGHLKSPLLAPRSYLPKDHNRTPYLS